MSLGERIKSLRLARALTGVELAKMVGIKPPSLSLIENGHTKTLKASTILRFAEVFGVLPQWIETGRGPMFKVAAEDVDEVEVISIARTLTSQNREAWLATGRALIATQPASAGNPYPVKNGN